MLVHSISEAASTYISPYESVLSEVMSVRQEFLKCVSQPLRTSQYTHWGAVGCPQWPLTFS